MFADYPVHRHRPAIYPKLFGYPWTTIGLIYYNANDSVLLANNIYDELGQLEKKNLHSENSGNFVQSFDYDYCIRGWLTAINDPQSLGTAKFGMKLFYDTQPSGLGNSTMYN